MSTRRSHIRLNKYVMGAAVVFALLVIMTAFAVVTAEMNNGAEKIELFGGLKGKVPFPHRMHQNKLGDCNICHSFFLQATGSIEDLKAKGELEKRQIMEKLCVNCHKEEKRAGNKSGPTACSKCHVR